MEIASRNKNYNQVCVYPGILLPEGKEENFERYFGSLGFRIQFLEKILTMPDKDSDGVPIVNTGGRSDILFAIHDEDIMDFAIPRLQMGIRWIEDVLDNEEEGCSIYPERVLEYRTW